MTTELCPDCGRPLRVTGADACRREHPTAELFGFDVECKDITIARLRAELACARVPRVPRTPVGPFTNGQLKSRPILLETDDAALGQLRDLVNALGNWHDFAAFNEVVRASARELSEAESADTNEDAELLRGYIRFYSGAVFDSPAKAALERITALALRAKKAGE